MRLFCLSLVCGLGFLHAVELTGDFITHVGQNGRQSIVEFFEKDGTYYAYGYANVDGSGPKKDINNPDPKLRERGDKGTVFGYGLQKSGDSYKNGFVYDYDDGKVYHLKAHFVDDNTLEMRASIDKLGMMGLTLTWKRLTKAQEEKYRPEKPQFSVVQESLKLLDEAK